MQAKAKKTKKNEVNAQNDAESNFIPCQNYKANNRNRKGVTYLGT